MPGEAGYHNLAIEALEEGNFDEAFRQVQEGFAARELSKTQAMRLRTRIAQAKALNAV